MSIVPTHRGFSIATAVMIGIVTVAHAAVADDRPNVLFIAIDDLRPQLGCYGCDFMVTPSLDRFAAEGRRFDRHYAQVPTCGASRCALLTGRYPSHPQAYDNDAFSLMPDSETGRPESLPQLFRENGYRTVCLGKISHSPDGLRQDGLPEVPFAWDELGVPAGKWGTGWDAFFAYADGGTRVRRKSPATERADVPDTGYPDGLIAEAAVAKLNELKDEPFFLAVGFFKPHLPFNAPARYWDLYDADAIPAAPNPTPPSGIDPMISLHRSNELTLQYAGFAKPGIVPDDEARRLRHGYAACVSYVDAQVGRVLGELDRLGLREKTIVVVWGDHGWHLGEHGIWGKHTLHDASLRSALVVRTPRMHAPGRSTAGLVESVDLYPTLAELCGLPAPTWLDGRSFASLLEEPESPGKAAVFGFWRGGRGHTIRTDRHRLISWTGRGAPQKPVQIELYDHHVDPAETENIAAEHPEVVEELVRELAEQVDFGSRN